MFFRTVPPANTLVRWVNENAFVSEVQTRPCPTFGRPVHLGLPPSITARYFSSCPSDSTSRWTPCPPEYNKRWLQVGLGCVQLSPSCPFRPLHTFRFLRPARLRTPLLGYGAPHLSARGTSTLLNNALLSAHFRLADHPPGTRKTESIQVHQYINLYALDDNPRRSSGPIHDREHLSSFTPASAQRSSFAGKNWWGRTCS